MEVLRAWLVELVDQVAQRLRRHDLRGCTVELKVRFADFKTISRSLTLAEPSNVTQELLDAGNCVYCSYANGLLANAHEITSRTGQYWCPIKHGRKLLGEHFRCDRSVNYGDSQNFHTRLEELRSALHKEK